MIFLLNQQTNKQLDMEIFLGSFREQEPMMDELYRDYDLREIECAIRQGENNKATGASRIPIEVVKAFDDNNTQGVCVKGI